METGVLPLKKKRPENHINPIWKVMPVPVDKADTISRKLVIVSLRPHFLFLSACCHQNNTRKMTTIYVGNLPNDTNESHAKTLFSCYGTVESINLTLTNSTHRFQGYGFVEMEDRAARTAIAELDGSVFEGAILCVNEATSAQIAQRDDNDDRGDSKPTLDDIPPSNVLRRYYQVASVESVPSPIAGAGDEWYRYELKSGPSSITGMHRGTLEEVTEYATECAAAFNMRSMKGKSARSMAPPRKKKAS